SRTSPTDAAGGPEMSCGSRSFPRQREVPPPGSNAPTTDAADRPVWADSPHRIQDHHELGRERRGLTPRLMLLNAHQSQGCAAGRVGHTHSHGSVTRAPNIPPACESSIIPSASKKAPP